MMLFGTTKYDLEQRRAHVASLLNCNPFTPGDWPMETIDRILKNVERAAQRQLDEDVQRIGVAMAARLGKK